MTELTKGEWSSFVPHGVFLVSEDGTLELDGQSCTILDSEGEEVKNLSATDREFPVSSGYKGYVIRGKVLLK
jgi:hypothetical protein